VQALAGVDRNSCRRGMPRGKLVVGAGAGTKVVGVCASIRSSTSSSSSPSILIGPPGRHHIHCTLHDESIKRESYRGVAVTNFVMGVAGGGGATTTERMASPARMPSRHLHDAWRPVRRNLRVASERVEYLLWSVGSRQRLVWCVSGGAHVVVRSPSVPHTRPFVGHLT